MVLVDTRNRFAASFVVSISFCSSFMKTSVLCVSVLSVMSEILSCAMPLCQASLFWRLKALTIFLVVCI